VADSVAPQPLRLRGRVRLARLGCGSAFEAGGMGPLGSLERRATRYDASANCGPFEARRDSTVGVASRPSGYAERLPGVALPGSEGYVTLE